MLSFKYLSGCLHSLHCSFFPSSIHPSSTLTQNHLSNLIWLLPFTLPYVSAYRKKKKSSNLSFQPYLLHLLSPPTSPADMSPSSQITTLFLSYLYVFVQGLPLTDILYTPSLFILESNFLFFVLQKGILTSPRERLILVVIIYLYVSPLTDCEILQSRGTLSCSSLHYPYCPTQSQHPRWLMKHLLNLWMSWIGNIW